ncbi:hydroxysqualene dehydroxylase HpnE [Hyphococcus sp. DH-69]|uniref:hydroxysqualene dehydroxylase HpnE n=1 Tax=Hyphococcus formosus TaxID=3143534 RepID=UPI00398A986E
MSRVHIIGAGLSGLAAAVRLIENDVKVTVYDSAGRAGGRCRTFFDKHLEREIDNGNHLIMSGNKSSLSYLDRIGSVDPLTGPKFAIYPFVDVKTKQRWNVRLNEGPIPFWVFDEKWRVPNTKIIDYLRAAKIAFANDEKTVADMVDPKSPLYERFWEPLTLAVLNTTPEKGQAKLLWRVIRETFLLGGQASVPLTAKTGLGHAFIDPAVKFIEQHGGIVRLGARLRSAWMEGGAVTSLNFSDETVTLEEGDKVIFAIPPSRLKQLLPDIDPPGDDASILNIHYRFGRPVPKTTLGDGPFLGMVSSAAQWTFVRDDVISITTSASDALGTDDMPNDQVVSQIWGEVCIALDLGDSEYERVRVIREKRATPDQSPAGVKKRLAPETAYRNLFLAGDHTDTDVPATIEGSIRSGDRAAELVMRTQG